MKNFTFFILFASLAFLPFDSSAGGPGSNRLIFLGTADLQGKLDPVPRKIDVYKDGNETTVVGGISRLAAKIKEIQQTSGGPVAVISSGDDLMGRYFHFFDGKAIIHLMGLAGYDLLGLGNHEFDRGSGLLGEALEQADFTTICSDLKVKGTAMEGQCQPHVIKEYDAIRVGFFSLMTEEFPFITSGGDVTLMGDNKTVARKMVATLQSEGVDIIVAVTHIGARQDRLLAAEVDGIDIIFGGHSHDYLPEVERVGNTLIVNGGEKGAALVYLDVGLTPDNQVLREETRFKLIPITEDIQENTEVAKVFQNYREKMPQAVVLGSTETAWNLSKEKVRSGESEVADLINDLVRKKFKVDIVLNNGGAFRGNKEYPPGQVTDKMLHEIDEFENDVYLLKIKGKHLKEILEHSASQVGTGGFLQVSGVRFTISMAAQSQQIGEQNGTWSVSQPGKRVSDIQVATDNDAFAPIDPEAVYSVASNAYLAGRMGDKYFWFKQYGQDPVNTYTSLYSILAEEFNNSKVINPPEPDGRILVQE